MTATRASRPTAVLLVAVAVAIVLAVVLLVPRAPDARPTPVVNAEAADRTPAPSAELVRDRTVDDAPRERVGRELLLLGCDGAPFVDAAVEVEGHAELGALASNASGVVSLSEVIASAKTLVLRVRGSRHALRAADPPETRDGRIVLRPTPLARGRVTCASDPSAVARARVACVPGALFDALAADPGAALADPRIRKLDVDSEGRFELCDDDAATFTFVAASGTCLAPLVPVVLDRGRTAEIELPLRPAAGCAVRLVDPSGGPPRLASRAWALNTGVEIDVPEELAASGWSEAMNLLVPAVLAGMDPELAKPQTSAFVLLFTGDAPLRSNAEVEIVATSAGYERTRAKATLRPIADLHRFEDVVLARPDGTATLDVRILGPNVCTQPITTLLPAMRLGLRPLDRKAVESFDLVLDPTPGASNLFAGVPPGRYRASARDLADALVVPNGGTLELTDGATTTLELDARETGCIVLHPKSPKGEELTGTFEVTLLLQRVARGRIVVLLRFNAPPYAIAFRPPGEQELVMTSLETGTKAQVSAHVDAGRATDVEVRFGG